VKHLSLTEFQDLVGLSDSALVWLLKNSDLECHIGDDGKIRVDASSTSTKDLVKALTTANKELLQKDAQMIKEKLSQMIGEEFENISREALSRYLSKRL